VELLLQRGAERLIHLGDIGTVEVIDALCVSAADGSGQLPAHLVFGNTDWDLDSLEDYALDLDIRVDHPVGELALDGGQRLIYCHGHEAEPMERAIAEGARYLCHGHTHRQADDRQGSTRVLNPGALFRAKTYSVGLLDTEADRFDLIDVSS
jgi:predicted phosphodiesterase